MKHEWKKKEKDLYLPKDKPQVIQVPKMQYFVIDGQGNPNSPEFSVYIECLYAASYGVRMSYKTDDVPKDYYEYTVYPLEGIWDLTEKGRRTYDQGLDKDELVFQLMIRQPDFVDEAFANRILERVKKKKPKLPIERIAFRSYEEGQAIQMLHKGPYDTESESFKVMEDYMKTLNLSRIDKTHKEIYLSDARKVEAEKLKTVLRIWVK